MLLKLKDHRKITDIIIPSFSALSTASLTRRITVTMEANLRFKQTTNQTPGYKGLIYYTLVVLSDRQEKHEIYI